MNRTKRFDYFEAYVELTQVCQATIDDFLDVISHQPITLDADTLTRIHEMENKADGINNEIQKHLALDFVVPLERDNMSMLAHGLDRVEDSLEELFGRMFIYHIHETDAAMNDMAHLIHEAIGTLTHAVSLIKGASKNYHAAHQALLNVHAIEEKGDRLYVQTLYNLYDQTEIVGEDRQILHRVYDAFESVLDGIDRTATDIEFILSQNM